MGPFLDYLRAGFRRRRARATAYAINNHGQIVGQSENANRAVRAVLWHGGQCTDLGTLPGGDTSHAQSINDRGQIVGFSRQLTPFGYRRRAVLWKDGERIALGTLPGHRHSDAHAINNAGQIVGVSYPEHYSNRHAVLWDDGRIIDLGGLPGAEGSWAHGINDRGLIVGRSDFRAVRWQDGSIIALEALPESRWSNATAVNSHGQIIGHSSVGPDWISYGVFWEAGQCRVLSTLPGDVESGAADINDHGQMVGKSNFVSDPQCDDLPEEPVDFDMWNCVWRMRAVTWLDGHIVDLGALPGGENCEAHAINNTGQIVGQSDATGPHDSPAVLWENGEVISLGSLTKPGYRPVDSPAAPA